VNLSDRFAAFSPEIQSVLKQCRAIAERRGQRGVIVGGCVRDLLLNVPAGDVDLMFEAPVQPLVEELAAAGGATFVSHPRFMTHTLKGGAGWKLDVVTARTETYPAPAQLPKVAPAALEADFHRRDFTVNAIACWISGAPVGEVLDPLNGCADLERKLIRALHPQSFEDDPTRIYRAARFAGRFGFSVETQTESWIRTAVRERRPAALSPVRRRHEFEILLKETDPAAALALLKQWGALGLILPDWNDVEEKRFAFSSPPVLEERLAEWFAPWGKERAQQMMTDLSFEKTVKSSVLSKLVQSRPRT
jgi:tRNA nucleotidyltransferase (CCA-adding enzyme)